ncbi:MAG TPA: DUF4199 domain-containing protein [Chitinophagaceae bacterium]|nr:DUF4199 domain-containing protein [Chitinophagaceae bacterium]
MERKITSHVTKALIISGLLLVLDLFLQKQYQPLPDGTRYMVRLVLVFIGVLAGGILFSRQSGGNRSFSEVFSHGFKTTAAIAFLMALYTFIAVKYIDPPPSAADMETAIKSYEQQGNALHEEAKKLAQEAAASRWVFYVSVSIFATVIPGVLGALLAAVITKKRA